MLSTHQELFGGTAKYSTTAILFVVLQHTFIMGISLAAVVIKNCMSYIPCSTSIFMQKVGSDHLALVSEFSFPSRTEKGENATTATDIAVPASREENDLPVTDLC